VLEPSPRHKEYKLRLPVIFRWNDGTEHTEGGFTSQIALDRALIFSSSRPPVGTDVCIEVLFPCPAGEGREIRVACRGRVVQSAEAFRDDAFVVQGQFDDDYLMYPALCHQ
jgi:hypothetical protein